MSEPRPQQTFTGVRVVDFSQVLAGPYCTEQLALQGADVIKIEQPNGGDQGRGMMAPDGPYSEMGLSGIYLAVNSGKRSLTLDLKAPEARDVIHRLVKDADVVVQNFKAGTLDRMGFGWKDLQKINPKLIYCSISGYGQSGPRASAAAYDPAVQAGSGMMSMTGYDETGPTKAGFWVVDFATGITAAFAVAGALYKRSVTGRGQHLDVAMLDTAVSFISPMVTNYLVNGVEPFLMGNGSPGSSNVSSVYPTRDGYLQVSPGTQGQFENMCRCIGRDDMIANPLFKDRKVRIAHAPAMREEIISALAADHAISWESRLMAAGVPAAAVLTVPQMLDTAQIKHRNIIMDLPAPDKSLPGRLKGVKLGFTSDDGPPGTDNPAPLLGQHTDAILAEIGYAPAEIAALRAKKVI